MAWWWGGIDDLQIFDMKLKRDTQRHTYIHRERKKLRVGCTIRSEMIETRSATV